MMIPVVSFSAHGFPVSPTEPGFSSFLAIALGVARQGRKVIAISLNPGAPDISDWMNFEWQPTRGVLDWLAGADEHVTEYFSEIKKPGWFFDTPRTRGAGRLGYSPATKQGNESLVVNGLRFQAFLVAIEKQIGDFVAFVYIPESLSREDLFSPASIGIHWKSDEDQAFLRNAAGPKGGMGYVAYQVRSELHHPLTGVSTKEGWISHQGFRESIGCWTPCTWQMGDPVHFAQYLPWVEWVEEALCFIKKKRV